MAVTSTRRADIAERVHRVRRSIEKVAIGESVLFLREITPDLLHSLHRDLIAPVSDLFAGKERVFIVGDGPLHTVPLRDVRHALHRSRAQRLRAGAARRRRQRGAALPGRIFGALAWLGCAASLRLPAQPVGADFPAPVPEGKSRVPASNWWRSPTRCSPRPPAWPCRRRPAARFSQLNVGFSRAGGAPEIPRLAETADEAREIAGVLGGQSRLYIGNEAQESARQAERPARGALRAVRHTRLSGRRVRRQRSAAGRGRGRAARVGAARGAAFAGADPGRRPQGRGRPCSP
jgi:hypothetical protein